MFLLKDFIHGGTELTMGKITPFISRKVVEIKIKTFFLYSKLFNPDGNKQLNSDHIQ
jgi:hypothetical protein